ncbi:MAG: hypothetical protein AB7P14_12945 [Blastocatellales bacterium]
MLSLVNSQTTLRPVIPAAYVLPPDLCYATPSCGPIVQHELLKVVREEMPEAYKRAQQELGLNVARTQELIERRVEIISSAKAIKLARLIAYEPNSRRVFGQTGQNLFGNLNRNFPGLVKTAVRSLPRSLRTRLALTLTRRVAYEFAGSLNRFAFRPIRGGVAVSICNGVFADQLDTLGGAHAYYGNIIETMFQEFAHVDCEVSEVRAPRVYLNQCHYKIVWEA